MLNCPMDILHKFPVRKTKAQKEAFRSAVQEYAKSIGYECRVERRNLNCQNVLFGDPEKASYLVTAHYDTCARLPFPNFIMPCNGAVFVLCRIGKWLLIALIAVVVSVFSALLLGEWSLIPAAVLSVAATVLLALIGPANKQNANDNTSGVVTLLEIMRTMPENQREKVCFVLFDQEEAGLIGSSFYRSCHRRASETQLVLNLDCVGDGDHIRMFPTNKLKKDRKRLTSLYKACGYFGKKDVLVHEKGFGVYPSDQLRFPYGVGICALKKCKFGLYLGKIHTSKDMVLDETNVNILRAALTSFICCDEVN